MDVWCEVYAPHPIKFIRFIGASIHVSSHVCGVVCGCAPQDFVTLQFIPPGTDLQPILPVLAKVFDQVGGPETGEQLQWDTTYKLHQIASYHIARADGVWVPHLRRRRLRQCC